MSGFRLPEAGLYSAAAVLIAATVAWPPWSLHRQQARTRLEAETALQSIVARERSFLAAHHRYVAFGPSPTDRQAALPGAGLGQAEADFDFDAILDRAGVLRVRAVSRPDAIRDGRVTPLLTATELTDGPRTGQGDQK
ncbi:MAG: hypothetical protein JO264_17965 [Acidisphaera sp.]|nr:hypothetical protein [Acidisphaera sp.]